MSHVLLERIQKFKSMYPGKRGDAILAIASYGGYKNEGTVHAMMSGWKTGGKNARQSTIDRFEDAMRRSLKEHDIEWPSPRQAMATQSLKQWEGRGDPPKTEEEALAAIMGTKPMQTQPLEAVLTNIERAAVIQGVMNNRDMDISQKERILRILQPILAFKAPESHTS
jgi:hypothetical protein